MSAASEVSGIGPMYRKEWNQLTKTVVFDTVPLIIACEACPPERGAQECALYTDDREVHDAGCGCPKAGQRVVRQQLLCVEHTWRTLPYHHSGANFGEWFPPWAVE